MYAEMTEMNAVVTKLLGLNFEAQQPSGGLPTAASDPAKAPPQDGAFP